MRPLAGVGIVLAVTAFEGVASAHEPLYETWLVDQSNSAGLTHGGTIHIYAGEDIGAAKSTPVVASETIDLGGAAADLCFASTGAYPVRPHMLLANGANTHMILAYVATGHVVIFDAETRTPVSCLRASVGSNGLRQAHAAIPSKDDTYILIANQNGKRVERINADYDTDTFTLDPAATVDLITCTTPSGAPCEAAGIRPDNAPICPNIDDSGDLAFITLRGGGLLVLDPRVTPMQIMAEYDVANIGGNGCGMDTATTDTMFVNAAAAKLYRLPLSGYSASNPPNTPAPTMIWSDATPGRDTHGMVLTKNDATLWMVDRAVGVIEVFDVLTSAHVNTLNLVGTFSADPAPDLIDNSPDGEHIVVSTRGAIPLSGDPHASTGADPGLLVLEPGMNGSTGEILDLSPISNVGADGVDRADPHTVRVIERTWEQEHAPDCE